MRVKRDGDLTRLAFSSWPRAFRAENAVRNFAVPYLCTGVSLVLWGIPHNSKERRRRASSALCAGRITAGAMPHNINLAQSNGAELKYNIKKAALRDGVQDGRRDV